MNSSKIGIVFAIVIVVAAVVVAAAYLGGSHATIPSTSTVTPTTASTTTVLPVTNYTVAPRALTQAQFQAAFGANGTYKLSSTTLRAPINNRTSIMNVTTAQFNFSTFGYTNVVETITYPTTNYTGYTARLWYSSTVKSFANYSGNGTTPTTEANGTVSGMTYTLFTQQTGAGGQIHLYLLGYNGITGVSLDLKGFTTAATPAAQNSLIASIAGSS